MIWMDLDSLEERCLLCRETKPRQDLDRLLWCDACVADAKARALSRSWYVGSAIALVLALVSGIHYQTKVGLADLLKGREAKLKTLQAIVDQVNAFEVRAKAVRARLAVMTDLVQSRDLYPVFMTDLIESFPDGVWIGPLTTMTGVAK